MTNHTALIQRLTNATEGSRELDAAIDKYLYGFSDDWIEYEAGKWRHKVTGDLTYAVNYTTSIDAALTLVPEGLGWSAYSALASQNDDALAVIAGDGATGKIRVETNAATPALALCIAALKAQDTPHGGRMNATMLSRLAIAACEADETAPNPHSPIYINMRSAKAWEARVPMVRAMLTVMREPTDEMEWRGAIGIQEYFESTDMGPKAGARAVWQHVIDSILNEDKE